MILNKSQALQIFSDYEGDIDFISNVSVTDVLPIYIRYNKDIIACNHIFYTWDDDYMISALTVTNDINLLNLITYTSRNI